MAQQLWARELKSIAKANRVVDGGIAPDMSATSGGTLQHVPGHGMVDFQYLYQVKKSLHSEGSQDQVLALTTKSIMLSTPHRTLPLHLVIFRRILNQPALLDLSDISNKCLTTRLHNLMEQHPIRFPILYSQSAH